MSGDQDDGTPARDQVVVNRDALGTVDSSSRVGCDAEGVPNASLNRAGGVQIGSGNVQVNYFYGGPGQAGDMSVLASAPRGADSIDRGHAFISYDQEYAAEVEILQRMLEAAGIAVWRDIGGLWAGLDWKARLREAISRDALVFIACFSSRSASRHRSRENTELLLATEELWSFGQVDRLKLVRFDDCDIPALDAGGRTLAWIPPADLFGADRDRKAQRLIGAIQRLLPQSQSPDTDPLDQAPLWAETAPAGRAIGREGLSVEGSARSEFRELRAIQQRAASMVMRLSRMKEGDAPTGQVQCPVCLHRFNWAKAWRSCYGWSQEQECYFLLSRQTSESDHHWNQRKANAWIRCPSESGRLEHYLPSLYGAYGEPIVITTAGQTFSGKTTLLTMLGVQLENNPILNGKLSFRPLDQALAEDFRRNYAKPLMEERKPPAGTAGEGFFHAWRGFNHATGRPFVLAFFDACGGDLVQENILPPFISASNAFLFLADAANLHTVGGDLAVNNIINALGPEHFNGLPTAGIISKSDLLRGHADVSKWLDRDDEADLSTIEQESEDAYAFLSLNAAPDWLRPIRELPSTTLHFLSATGTGAIDPYGMRFDGRNFGPHRVLRPLLKLLQEMGVVDIAQFNPHRS